MADRIRTGKEERQAARFNLIFERKNKDNDTKLRLHLHLQRHTKIGMLAAGAAVIAITVVLRLLR